ncbi:hypothetical protein [Homoserinimonas sp. OAct 916]|uniref:hypothetical protein n=1 Tax=Homoserinimonas sp. OAct 916 TaxID=2211450 RepID=UPI001E4BD903|nr:hypothetical protein [Homoserinimonas sp. OAct 916]
MSLLRLVGRLDEAWDVANEAARQARFTGSREDLLAARIRRAQVMQFMGRFDEALTELTTCVDEAAVHDWFRLQAFALQHRGKVYFDQDLLDEALADFRAAATLREELLERRTSTEVADSTDDELESSLIAVAVTESFLDERRRGE